MAATLLLTVVLLLFLLFQYHWKRRHLYKLAMKVSGPPALPIVGNGLSFMCKQENILGVINELTKKFEKPLRFWLGPSLFLYFSNAEHIQKILTSSKMATKHDIYDILKVYLGEGLITASGDIHRKHRRLIQPLLNAKFSLQNMETFQKHIDVLLNRLQVHCGKGTFDIHNMIHLCFADIIGESLLGAKINAQYGQNMDYIQASSDIYIVGYDRLMRPWYHPDFIYNLTSRITDQTRIANICHNFIHKCVTKALHRVRTRIEDDETLVRPLIDQIANLIQKDGTNMDQKNLVHHMLTIYLASEDTMTLITAMLCVCFGMYPEYQKIAAEEIRSVCGEEPGLITNDNLSKLPYLDMCIKDVLRIIPIAPIIARKPVEDFQIDNLLIPKDCGVVLSIFQVHRDPKHWENPDHFYPNHFLPEAVKQRHPFAFVPFSAGSRSCIGQQLAFFGLRLAMVNILQRFIIEADGKFPDIVLISDITIRSLSGYKVRIKKRVWD